VLSASSHPGPLANPTASKKPVKRPDTAALAVGRRMEIPLIMLRFYRVAVTHFLHRDRLDRVQNRRQEKGRHLAGPERSFA
jgi:hypothetical protein